MSKQFQKLTAGEGWTLIPATDGSSPSSPSSSAGSPKFRIEMEKRPGGKIVTLIRGIPETEDLTTIAKKLKASCGCGGTILEDRTIELQGDQRSRLQSWIEHFAATRNRGKPHA